MPRLRMQPEQQVEAAIEELETLASASRGIAAVRSGPEQVNLTVGRHSWPARVIALDAVSLREAHRLVTTEARGSKIIVANQLSTEAKEFLTHHNESIRSYGWSWLDRRGELQLNHPKASGVVAFDRFSPNRRAGLPSGWKLAAPRSDGPIRGRAGISCAAALLLHPDAPPSIRVIARQAQMSHGAVGEASKLLREAGLVLRSGKPQIPELFWALAAVWGATRVTPVTNPPSHENAEHLRANPDDLESPGWCLGGDEAARAWGAPVFFGAGRPWIWVPQEGDARRAERMLTTATWNEYAAVIAVPPTAILCSNRARVPLNGPLSFLPTALPLFLALDLAQDPARGREILEHWHPDRPEAQRVW